MPRDDTFSCPHCGEEILRSARACPHCGSDDATGWSDTTYLDGIDLPDDDEYQEIQEREFGEHSTGRMWVAVIAVIVIIIFAAGIIAVLR